MVYDVHSRLDTLGVRFKGISNDPLGTVTYVRRDKFSITAVATLLRPPEVIDITPNTSVMRVRYKDFVFDTADLVDCGVQIVPREGDEVIRSNREMYRVIQSPNTGKVYDYITTSRKRVRIHCEYLGQDP